MKANYQDKIEETKVNGNFAMSLYDLNKQIVMQQADLDEAGRQTAIALINNYVKSDKFFMLLGKEIGYYTVFMRESIAITNETIGEAVIDCLNSIGTIKSIDKLENNDAIEIWVVKENEPTVLYFFPYNEGVIICQ